MITGDTLDALWTKLKKLPKVATNQQADDDATPRETMADKIQNEVGGEEKEKKDED